MTVKEFCDKYEMKYQTVYKRIKNNRNKALDGHITKEKGRSMELDEYAENYLKSIYVKINEFEPECMRIVWENNELRTVTAILLDTSENDLAEISDYDRFMELVDLGYENDVPAKLAKLKAEAIANMPSPTPVRKAEQSEQSTVNAPEKITVPEIKEPKSGVPVTYHFNSDDVVTGGVKTKFRANIEAIQTLQKIEAENRYATPEEQSIMAKYVGWGGIPQAFVSDRIAENIGGNLGEAAPSGWETEQQQLR